MPEGTSVQVVIAQQEIEDIATVATSVTVPAGAGGLARQVHPKREMPVMFRERALSQSGSIKGDIATNEG